MSKIADAVINKLQDSSYPRLHKLNHSNYTAIKLTSTMSLDLEDYPEEIYLLQDGAIVMEFEGKDRKNIIKAVDIFIAKTLFNENK